MESCAIENNPAPNQVSDPVATTSTDSISSGGNGVPSQCIVEFMHDLKKAIQDGQLKSSSSREENGESTVGADENLESTTSNVLDNVNNLSSQLFGYIVNWLKTNQQQSKSSELNVSLNVRKKTIKVVR